MNIQQTPVAASDGISKWIKISSIVLQVGSVVILLIMMFSGQLIFTSTSASFVPQSILEQTDENNE